MRITIELRQDSEVRDHELEISPQSALKADRGRLEAKLDGQLVLVDWAEVSPGVYSLIVDGQSYEVHLTNPPHDEGAGNAESRSRRAGSSYLASLATRRYHLEVRDQRLRSPSEPGSPLEGPQEIAAPMPGKIIRILVSESQEVRAGDGLLVMEAMKMQNELRAPRAGRVEEIHAVEGAAVETGFKLLRLGFSQLTSGGKR